MFKIYLLNEFLGKKTFKLLFYFIFKYSNKGHRIQVENFNENKMTLIKMYLKLCSRYLKKNSQFLTEIILLFIKIWSLLEKKIT